MRRCLTPTVVTVVTVLMVGIPESAVTPPPAQLEDGSLGSSRAMVAAARAFLDGLTPELKTMALLPFASDERMNWHYIPRQRQGLPLKAMTEPQRQAAIALLRTGLSEKGYLKAETIRALEDVLLERGGDPKVRDKELFFFTIFGEPGARSTWGWRYEGHHLSQNWTIVNGAALATTPQFFGANPAAVRTGKMAGTRPLAAEEDLGFQLLRALTAQQRQTAIVAAESPADMLTTNSRQAAMQADSGIAYGQMSEAQQRVLVQLIAEHASAQPDPVARERIEKVRAAGLDRVRFAWMGGTEQGQGHYYRIQGPTFLVEFDNTQDNANHIHDVWRDFKGDFGRDLLADHYENAPHHQKPPR